ncbi:MAG: succinylglutamate desuccinylase/aspartoacylase family protein [Hyphomicrobiales bacterium]|nr:succinylglutamate desuccinylase/aspartoacylase family protein [Hyphomicrobiales bacterium]
MNSWTEWARLSLVRIDSMGEFRDMASMPTVKIRVRRTGKACHRGMLSIGDWETPCVVGEGGLVAASLKREGDKRTPIGLFPLRYGLFDPKAVPDFPRDLAFPFVPASEDMIWEEEGADYNRLVRVVGKERLDERLTRKREEPLFDVIVPIGFNDAVPEAGRGSALFIHAARSDMRGTAGCIAVPRAQILELARRLVPGMMIDIDHEARETILRPRASNGAAMEIVRFAGAEPGPKLIVTGAVHGNETCGPEAITRVIGELRDGKLAIRRGAVTFVPIVNHKAYLQGTREGDRNLNRDLRPYVLPECHEDRIANILCPLIAEHDVLLDLHSFRSGHEPFVFVGPSDNDGEIEPFALAKSEGEFAARLGPSLLMHGWLTAHARAQRERARQGSANVSFSKGVGTTEYMRFCGGYAVTVECGQHRDPMAPQVARDAILNGLAHFQLIAAPAPKRSAKRAISIVDAVWCFSEGDRLEKAWTTGDAVAAGEIIARRADGEALKAPRDGFVIFPNPEPKPFVELYYFGEASQRFAG